MNKIPKKIISLVLTAIIVASSIGVVGFLSFAAETDNEISNAQNDYPTEEVSDTSVQQLTQSVCLPGVNPGKVKNIVKTDYETNSITLKWDEVSGVSGYNVYCCNEDDKKDDYLKVASVKTNSATIKNLCDTTRYNFQVSAFITKNGVDYEGEKTTKTAVTRPAEVSGLTRVRSSSVIELRWNRNALATGYKVYRYVSGKSSEYTLVKTIKDNSIVNYVDKRVKEGTVYYYKVNAYREITEEREKTYHSTGSIIRFMSGLTDVNATLTSQINRVSLTWKKNKYATGYNLYYSTAKDGNYTLLGTTKNDYYNTQKLTANKTYYFRVIPYKTHGAKKHNIEGTYSTISKKVSPNAFGHSVGNTYVEVSIKQQHMWFYKNGKLIVSTDVVTGNADGEHNTPKGYYTMWQRSTSTTLVGTGYSSYVDYWMAFNGGIGIHDASWRSDSEYGGTTYLGNGSHGCVNTPLKNAKTIYQNTGYGTPVIVF